MTHPNILCLMYLLNQLHVKEYLGFGGPKIRKIEEWIELIPDNAAMEGRRSVQKRVLNRVSRTVPLFDLPLSAGPGNIFFDNSVPHDEDDEYEKYETDNKYCDYALRVSGDSMEPDIPDGSIVLIRETEEIANGKIGAFRLNNEAFCKRFYRDKEGKAFLISSNTLYAPILIKESDDFHVFGQVIEVCEAS